MLQHNTQPEMNIGMNKQDVEHERKLAALHITEIFFFHELSRTVGFKSSKEWLGDVVSRNNRLNQQECKEPKRAVSKRKVPPLQASSSFKSISSCDKTPSNRDSPTCSSCFGDVLRSPTASLHASDLENVVVTSFQLERTRSSPAVIGNVSKRADQIGTGTTVAEICNFGLLFTDAAHTVINDLGNMLLIGEPLND